MIKMIMMIMIMIGMMMMMKMRRIKQAAAQEVLAGHRPLFAVNTLCSVNYTRFQTVLRDDDDDGDDKDVWGLTSEKKVIL